MKLADMLFSENAEVRRDAVKKESYWISRQEADALASDPFSMVRRQVAESLYRKLSFALIDSLLTDPDPAVRKAMVKSALSLTPFALERALRDSATRSLALGRREFSDDWTGFPEAWAAGFARCVRIAEEYGYKIGGRSEN